MSGITLHNYTDNAGSYIEEERDAKGQHSIWTIIHPDDPKQSLVVNSDAAGNIAEAHAHPYVGKTVAEMLTNFVEY